MINIFDIGCDDGFLLKKMVGRTERQDGCDPLLRVAFISPNSKLMKGYFPKVIQDHHIQTSYDAIFALAVFEHFTENDLRESATVIHNMLTPEGRLIVTIPHPFVDQLLDLLLAFHLIDGQAVEEHHGFEPEKLLDYFSDSLRCIKRKRFQLGLNNVFIFQRL
jgi:2-polyprenyl-3-methyl-5-hydroxy-6-metoxy-1,4-benzoquinol methylase